MQQLRFHASNASCRANHGGETVEGLVERFLKVHSIVFWLQKPV
jgi:hypothetical protein